jgi:hypothetical protein
VGVMKSARGCIGSILTGLMLVAAAYGGWKWGDHVFPRFESWIAGSPSVGQSIDVSEVAAQAAEGRFDRFAATGGPGEVLFDSNELTSLMRYRAAALLPASVLEPEIAITDDRAALSARVALDQVPQFPDLRELDALLSDTVPFTAEGTLIPSRGTGAAFLVDRLLIGRVPLPRRVIPSVLSALGRTDQAGLPSDAIEVPLPSGAISAYLRDGHLVLTGEGG